MGAAIGDTLPLALGVAFSPMPIVAVILMLVSRRGKVNASLFVLAWLGGVALLSVLVLLLAGGHDYARGSEPSLIASLVKVAFGLLLLFVAYRSWKSRPRPGEQPEPPQWMQALDQFSPAKALRLGALLATLNAKNLPITVTAATTFAQAGLTGTQTVIAVAVFAIIATVGVGVPLSVALAGGEKAQAILDGWKTWLSDNNAVIMFVLFLFLGLNALGKGLGGLF